MSDSAPIHLSSRVRISLDMDDLYNPPQDVVQAVLDALGYTDPAQRHEALGIWLTGHRAMLSVMDPEGKTTIHG